MSKDKITGLEKIQELLFGKVVYGGKEDIKEKGKKGKGKS